jgi:alpha-D-ribose 1-methylphosphonate 5-triphosphate synthase subunit PhnI
MYVAVKGGEAAIAASLRLLDEQRRGDPAVRELEVAQLREQLGLAVSRVMAEGALYDPELAALALKQALGDALEATFLLRAYRSTLPRLGYAEPVDTAAMRCERRVSSIFKDLPGGQLLGASFDYSQRLLEFGLLQPGGPAARPELEPTGAAAEPMPHALATLGEAGLIEQEQPAAGDPEPADITREPPLYPLSRAARLQMLARADEGWVLGLAYSTQRGYANTHPFAGEIRHGQVSVSLVPDELGFPIEIGELEMTECQMVNQFVGSAEQPPQFTRGYGLVLGHAERKAMAMSLVDRALRADEFGEAITSPAQQQEFALAHGDNVEASGFVQHLKLPHYVTFESELQMLRAIRAGLARPAGVSEEAQP